jgi:hypothetical protein
LNDTILCGIIFKEKLEGKINVEKGGKKIYKEGEGRRYIGINSGEIKEGRIKME